LGKYSFAGKNIPCNKKRELFTMLWINAKISIHPPSFFSNDNFGINEN
jgi:hypothetical protein